MKTKLIIVSIAAALAWPGLGHALTKAERDAEVKRLDADYDSAKKRCDGLSGNAKDICMAQAKGVRNVGKADLEAREKGTPKARYDARIARADADYDVAKEKCDEYAGNSKDVCMKDAKVAMTRAKADARVERERLEANKRSMDRTAEVRRDTGNEVRDAEYQAAVERCDPFSGEAKDRCVADAKARFRR
jgi:phage-related minor tail protein